MSRLTTAVLFLLVAALGLAVWLQTEREDPELFQDVQPLFEDLDARRVSLIRFENLERSIHLGIERDARGRWFLVDPIAYPARTEYVRLLLQAAHNQAWRVPRAEGQLAEKGLDPPRAVLQLVERLADGGQRQHRLELGDVDLDGRVYVRTRDQIFRTLRNLETPLEAPLHEWRSRAVFDLDARRIVEVQRRGVDFRGPEQVPLGLDAVREGPTWRLTSPWSIHADPALLTGWSSALAALSVDSFASDWERVDLARFDLADPWFSLTLLDGNGVSQTVYFARVGAHSFAKRADLPYVWELDPREVSKVTEDVREFFDETLVRVFRRDVDALLLQGPEHQIRLEQPEEGRWTVSWREGDSEPWTPPRPAHAPAVEGILATLEQEPVVAYRWEDDVAQHFPEDQPVSAVWVEAGGYRHGGRVGEPFLTAAGSEVCPFLREREDRVCLVPVALRALLDRSPWEFVSKILVDIRGDQKLFQIVIGERTFHRKPQGIWVGIDEDVDSNLEARELFPVLDRLLPLKGSRHVLPEEQEELLEAVRIEIKPRGPREDARSLTVGRTAAGEVRAEIDGAQAVLAHPELHGMVLAIARGGEPGEGDAGDGD